MMLMIEPRCLIGHHLEPISVSGCFRGSEKKVPLLGSFASSSLSDETASRDRDTA
jgi:hypothetical protein